MRPCSLGFESVLVSPTRRSARLHHHARSRGAARAGRFTPATVGISLILAERGEGTQPVSTVVSDSAAGARRSSLSCAAVIVVLFCGGCSAPTDPERPAVDALEIVFSPFQRQQLMPGGFLFVEATPVDWSYRLPSERYLPVVVTSSAGESEQMRLHRAICGLESRQSHLCRLFSVTISVRERLRLRRLASHDAICPFPAQRRICGACSRLGFGGRCADSIRRTSCWCAAL